MKQRPYAPDELELVEKLPMPRGLIDCFLLALDQISNEIIADDPTHRKVGIRSFNIFSATAPIDDHGPYNQTVAFGDIDYNPKVSSRQPIIALFNLRKDWDRPPMDDEREIIQGDDESLDVLYRTYGELAKRPPRLWFNIWIGFIISVVIEHKVRMFWHTAISSNGQCQLNAEFNYDNAVWSWTFNVSTAQRLDEMADAGQRTVRLN